MPIWGRLGLQAFEETMCWAFGRIPRALGAFNTNQVSSDCASLQTHLLTLIPVTVDDINRA